MLYRDSIYYLFLEKFMNSTCLLILEKKKKKKALMSFYIPALTILDKYCSGMKNGALELLVTWINQPTPACFTSNPDMQYCNSQQIKYSCSHFNQCRQKLSK